MKSFSSGPEKGNFKQPKATAVAAVAFQRKDATSMDMIQTLAQELNKDPRHVENVVRLLDEGNTIPFIARYRKELHGAMDDTSLRTLEERLQYLRGLEERRDTVKKSIEEQGKLTEELAAASSGRGQSRS